MGNAFQSVLPHEIDRVILLKEVNLLHDYYATGTGVSQRYVLMQRSLTKLPHKYPNLDYLEIAVGKGVQQGQAIFSMR